MIISLPVDQRVRLRKRLRQAGQREIGGILMGEQIGPDHFRIADFSIDETTGTATHFVRNAEHHVVALDEFFRRTGSDYRRFNYLGEWHSHPSFSVKPSIQDISSMQSLVDGENGIEFSALLIVRLYSLISLEVTACMFIRNAVPRRVQIIG